MLKSDLYRVLRTELHRHDFSTFVDEPPCIAQGGQGVVVTGCPTCKKKFGTMPQFLDHLTDDVLPALLGRLSQESWTRGPLTSVPTTALPGAGDHHRRRDQQG
jgi:hypothetical protein